MTQPTRSQVHVNRPLTNISIAYIQDQMNFIAGRVFPSVPVTNQSDVYYIYDKNDWFRDEAEQRAPGDESAGSGYNLSQGTYSAKVYAIHKDVPDQIRANADPVINPDRDASEFVTQRLLLRRELQFVTNYFAAGIWDTDVTPGTLWDASSSTPLADVDTGKATILSTTGFEPNTLVLGYEVFNALRNNADIIDRYKHTTAESITTDMLARLFDLERVLVAKAVKATNLENETASYSLAYGKHALLCYSNPTPSPLRPSAGYTFGWSGLAPQMGSGDFRIKNFRIEEREVDRIEGEMAWDMKVIATDLGYFFEDVVS